MLALLNDATNGSRIAVVYVTYRKPDGSINPLYQGFWNAINKNSG